MATKIDQAVAWAKAIAQDDSHGYDQGNRWGKDYDCSSLVITAFQQAGVPVKTKGATYTGNMSSVFKQCGFTDVTSKVNLATGAGLQKGDVLLNHVHHTALWIGGGQMVQASSNEFGGVTGGKTGDQTGREIRINGYYNYPWNCVLRYTGESVSSGSVSEALAVNGICDPATVRKWQSVMKTTVDGVISGQLVPDQRTYWRPNLADICVTYGGYGSELIRAVQKQLKAEKRYMGEIDGLLGPATIKAIQAHYGLTQDASFGPATVKALQTALNKNEF